MKPTVYHYAPDLYAGVIAACGRKIQNTMAATVEPGRVTCIRCCKTLPQSHTCTHRVADHGCWCAAGVDHLSSEFMASAPA